MGLDVRCVYNLIPSDEDDDCDVYINNSKFEEVDHITKFEAGGYTGESSCTFRAGAYSTYNRFRNCISTTILKVEAREVWEKPFQYKDKPFFEFINFSDCDACFDYVIAEKLLKDFTEHKDVVVREFEKLEPQFVEVYNSFIEVLKEAVDKKGLVQYY